MCLKRSICRILARTVLAIVLGTVHSAAFARAAPVRVDAVRTESTVERRLVTGDVVAVLRSQVATREPGVVMSIAVDVGDALKAGDVLAKLDDSKLRILLEEVQSQQRVEEARIAQRVALLDQAKRDAKLIRDSFERGAANPKEMLDAETEILTADANLAEVRQEVAVQVARADLLRRRIDDMKITAPFDGIVVTKFTELGQWVSEGDAVVELISEGMVEAWLNVPQRLFAQIRQLEHSSLPVVIDAGSTQVQATFDRLIPEMHPSARSFRLIVRVPNTDAAMAPGMSITGWVPTGAKSLQLTVHKNAVLRNDAGPFVYAVRAGGDGASMQAVPVQVRLMYPQGERYIVEAGALSDGDEVIVEGNERLFPYSAVQPVRESLLKSPVGQSDTE